MRSEGLGRGFEEERVMGAGFQKTLTAAVLGAVVEARTPLRGH